MTPSPIPTPDFNQIAATFDRFLPQIHPVTLALLDHLPPPADGATVLDVACGTGEPGLTLARRAPAVHLLGVDRADAMIAAARQKAARDSLTNARFEVMESEALALADGSVDAVISRFGLLLFGDVPKTARELARVLRVGGPFSIAVWDEPAKNTLMSAVSRVMNDHLRTGQGSALDRLLSEWAGEEPRARLLRESGLGVVRSELFSWSYEFASFDDVWALVSGMGGFTGQATLSPAAQQQAKQEVAAALAAHRQPDGAYSIPHACRLLFGQR